MEAATEPSFAVNDVVADFGAETLRDRAGHPLPLRPQAFAVLRYLAANPGRLVTKDELMAAVWRGVAVTDDSLVQCIGDIRRAIGDEAHAVVRTVPRRGYRLVAPAEPAAAATGRSLRRRSLAAATALLIAGAVVVGWLASRPPPAVASMDGPPIVALVPFVDLTRDGTAEGLFTELEKQCNFARDFVIVRRGPSFVYRDQPAGGLVIDYVFSGRVERDGDRLRIVAELTDAPTGALLWSERWDRPNDDVPAVHEEISALISNRLGGADGLIQPLGRAVAERKRPGDRTAWEHLLLGNGQLALGTRAGAAEAAALLGRAVELDPGLAHASALLALARLRLAEFGDDPEANLQAGIEAAQEAVFLDGLNPWAHAALGAGVRLSGDFVRARSEFETALVLSPNTADIMALFAGWAASGSDPERGAEIADRVVLLDPIVPPPTAVQLARAYFMAGRYRWALGMIERLPADGFTPAMRGMHASALAAVGRTDEAAAAVAAAPGLTIEAMASAPGWGDAERRRLVETMRLAGFPPCADPALLGEAETRVRLPECARQVEAMRQVGRTR